MISGYYIRIFIFVKNKNITLKLLKLNLFENVVYDIAYITILKEKLSRKIQNNNFQINEIIIAIKYSEKKNIYIYI